MEPSPAIAFEPSEFALIARLARRLSRPICILDLETTGFLHANAPPCGIVEIGYVVVRPDGNVHVGGSLVQPEMAIPYAATKVHGITNRDVINAPTLGAITQNIMRLFETAVVSGFNSREFDVPVLNANLAKYRCHHPGPRWQLDVRDIWRAGQGDAGKLGAVAQHYGVEAGTAHRAVGDALTAARILDAMLFEHGVAHVATHLRDAMADPAPAAQAAAAPEPEPRQQGPAAQPPPAHAQSVAREQPQNPDRVAAILAHVAEHGQVLPVHYQAIADQCRIRPTTVSYAISEMVEQGQLTEHQVADPLAQAIITAHIEQALDLVGDATRLKPLKEALERLTDTDIDYVQLRVAMRRWEAEPAARASASRPGMHGHGR